MKHTPAPWRQVIEHDSTGEAHHYIDTVGGDTIASCFTESDARLIAASPELADMLDDLLCLVEGKNRPEIVEKKIQQYGEFARGLIK